MLKRLAISFFAVMCLMAAVTFFRPGCAYKAYRAGNPELAKQIVRTGPSAMATMLYHRAFPSRGGVLNAQADGPIFPPPPFDDPPLCCGGCAITCECYRDGSASGLLNVWLCALCIGSPCSGGGCGPGCNWW